MKYLITLLLFSFMGCARFPKDYVDPREAKLKFSFTVEGKINRDYVYIVALATSKEINPTQEKGPLPVTEFPWGNGFVSGECTHYVMWKPHAIPPLELNKFINTNLDEKQFLGSITIFDSVKSDSKNKISFELTTDQLAQKSVIAAEEIKALKINFLTMNLIPFTQSDQKIGDSLGSSDPTQRAWITIPLNTNMIYDNAYYGSKKPSSNILDPDLKIVDYSVEVIRP